MAKRPKSGKYLQVVHVGVMADVVMEAGALVWEAVVGRRGGALLGLGHGDHVIGSAPEEVPLSLGRIGGRDGGGARGGGKGGK